MNMLWGRSTGLVAVLVTAVLAVAGMAVAAG